MSSKSPSAPPFHVVIAGGGVAALEAALALHALGGEAFDLTLIAPDADFVYRPMTVREPFAYGPARRYRLSEIAQDIGAELVVDSFAWLDASAQTVHVETGDPIVYDALLLALGARPCPRYEHATTVDDRYIDDVLHGLVQDVEGGYVHHLAFVVPPRMGWPLPIYELALMASRRAFDMSLELAVTLITPEDAPLSVFGQVASGAVARLLAERGVTVITGAACQVPDGRHVVAHPGQPSLEVDRVVALPELFGPAVRGLAAAEHGFIPVDHHGRVLGVADVYAAGDATDFPIKHGGLASQQADTAARTIAADAGLDVDNAPVPTVLRGILLTGADPLYLSAEIVGGHGFDSRAGATPTWSPPTKIAARHLAPYLEERDRVAAAGAR